MIIINFISAKQRKERGYSVEDVIKDVNENVHKIDNMIVIVTNDNKGIDVSFSGESDAELIGLLEVAKSMLVDGIRERE